MSVAEKNRAKAIELARSQFEEGESVVAAFSDMIVDTHSSTTPGGLAGAAGVAVGMSGQVMARAVQSLMLQNVPLVVTDRRVFVLACNKLKAPKEVAAVVPRDQVQVESVKINKLLKPNYLTIVIGDHRFNFRTMHMYADELRTLASEFGCKVDQ